jgi:hypothetical protein
VAKAKAARQKAAKFEQQASRMAKQEKLGTQARIQGQTYFTFDVAASKCDISVGTFNISEAGSISRSFSFLSPNHLHPGPRFRERFGWQRTQVCDFERQGVGFATTMH